ncbi:hypothetical protein BGZ76_005210 [Entomortierella beljakovae]|nr:hypothetical protein BGZ76_005210 [Entomortierella beljakovae]
MRKIAELHKNGYGIPKDDKKALEWYIEAANHHWDEELHVTQSPLVTNLTQTRFKFISL